MKPMHPTKFLGCNSWTLPFPIPAGGQGPAGLQSARSRAGPAGQSSGFWPLDLQRTLGCLGKPRGSDLSAKGWSGQGLEPKGEAFLRPPGCANRGRTTWFPAPRSPSSLTCGPHPSAAPTGCRPLGTQERTQWAFPAAMATPERTTGNPSPTPARSRPPPRAAPPLPCSRCLPSRSGDPRSTTGTDPHPQRSESPPAPPGLTPPRVRSRRGSSPSGGLREHNWDARPRSAMTGPPTPDPRPPPPGFTPPLVRSQRVSSSSGHPREHNWDRPPSPPRPGSRPAPPGFAPPRARSRCAAHLHHGLPVSPAPTPGSRRASGTSLPPPGETGGQSIQPTEAIQAV